MSKAGRVLDMLSEMGVLDTKQSTFREEPVSAAATSEDEVFEEAKVVRKTQTYSEITEEQEERMQLREEISEMRGELRETRKLLRRVVKMLKRPAEARESRRPEMRESRDSGRRPPTPPTPQVRAKAAPENVAAYTEALDLMNETPGLKRVLSTSIMDQE